MRASALLWQQKKKKKNYDARTERRNWTEPTSTDMV